MLGQKVRTKTFENLCTLLDTELNRLRVFYEFLTVWSLLEARSTHWGYRCVCEASPWMNG